MRIVRYDAARSVALPRRIGMVVAAACLTACADANYSRTSSDGPLEPLLVQSGVFKATANVGGLDYVSGSERGVTSDGRFTCETNLPVRFGIGALELGETLCATLVHPPALTESGTFEDQEAVNIARLLLILDSDGAPDNGISISESIRSVAGSWTAVDFAAADFFGELTQIVSDIASVEGRTINELPSSDDTLVHLDEKLYCAYSGAFGATPATGPYGDQTSIAVRIQRDPMTGIDGFSFQVYRVVSAAQMFVGVSGTVDLQTLPSLAGIYSEPGASMSAVFERPDLLRGRWMNPQTEHLVDRNVSFVVRRLGADAGEFRFTGQYAGASNFGVVALTLDGDALSGEVLDMYNNVILPVSGTRMGDSDTLELQVAPLTATATATLVRNADGAPAALLGGWPGLDPDSFQADACRLN